MSRKLAVAAVVAVLGAALQASAVLYTPVYLQPPSPVPQSSNPTDAEVAAALGITVADLGGMLYKVTPPSAEEVGAALFSTVFAPTPPPAGEQTAVLTYTGTLPAPKLSYIMVKDGRAGWTIWSAGGWNGSDDIQVDNRDLWNPNGTALSGISHIAVYGKFTSTKVPDGATTAMLLGLVMVGVGSCKRFIRG